MIVFVSHIHKLCYFGITKCGSTSVTTNFNFNFNFEPPISAPYMNPDFIKFAKKAGYTLFTVCREDIIGRFVAAFLEDSRIFKTLNDEQKLNFPELSHEDEKDNFYDYINCTTGHNLEQVEWLTCHGEIVELDYVLRLSHLEDDLNGMVKKIGFNLQIDCFQRLRGKKREDKRRIFDYIDDDFRKKIMERYERDILFINNKYDKN